MAKNILFMVAHPAMERSLANKAIAAKVAASGVATVHDLYGAYPDGKINVEKEQALLSAADLLVLQFPLQWYSVPGLLKEWQDNVLKYGFAFTLDGSPSKLRGKEVLISISSGGPKEAYSATGYNGHTYEELLLPLKQSFAMCQMKFLGVVAVGGLMVNTPEVKAKDIEAHANDMVNTLKKYAA